MDKAIRIEKINESFQKLKESNYSLVIPLCEQGFGGNLGLALRSAGQGIKGFGRDFVSGLRGTYNQGSSPLGGGAPPQSTSSAPETTNIAASTQQNAPATSGAGSPQGKAGIFGAFRNFAKENPAIASGLKAGAVGFALGGLPLALPLGIGYGLYKHYSNMKQASSGQNTPTAPTPPTPPSPTPPTPPTPPSPTPPSPTPPEPAPEPAPDGKEDMRISVMKAIAQSRTARQASNFDPNNTQTAGWKKVSQNVGQSSTQPPSNLATVSPNERSQRFASLMQDFQQRMSQLNARRNPVAVDVNQPAQQLTQGQQRLALPAGQQRLALPAGANSNVGRESSTVQDLRKRSAAQGEYAGTATRSQLINASISYDLSTRIMMINESMRKLNEAGPLAAIGPMVSKLLPTIGKIAVTQAMQPQTGQPQPGQPQPGQPQPGQPPQKQPSKLEQAIRFGDALVRGAQAPIGRYQGHSVSQSGENLGAEVQAGDYYSGRQNIR